jgi:hypothetical protein
MLGVNILINCILSVIYPPMEFLINISKALEEKQPKGSNLIHEELLYMGTAMLLKSYRKFQVDNSRKLFV